MGNMEIMSICRLLSMNLDIPAYQRPYKWTRRNMEELLGDIHNAIHDRKQYGEDFRYRIGTIILHRTGQGKKARFDIVDGQQRIISLVLLKFFLDRRFCCGILNRSFTSKVSQRNIHANYGTIRECFFQRGSDEAKQFLDAMGTTLEVVVIQVDRISEAFQLFDSQNSRGKALDPHDLLKAYHLREMKDYPYEMKHAVTRWEAKDTSSIRQLFDLFLFPIWNWSRGYKSRPFTAKEIDTYKGISETESYPYAKRASKAMPYFQITEPFIAGNDFFAMVEHYLELRGDMEAEIQKNTAFADIREALEGKQRSTGFGYAQNLFYCALLMYYDKFHNFDVTAVKKLFTWAFMLRTDMENLGFDSINKYAVGDINSRYTNQIAVFSKISLARVHTEISGLPVRVIREMDDAACEKWRKLYQQLKTMNGLAEEDNEEQ